jgi:hypothetical protein
VSLGRPRKTKWDTSAADANLLRNNVLTVKNNTETLIDASKELSLEVNGETIKYMLLSGHQNAGQKTANRSYKNVSQFNYLRTTVTNMSLVRKKLRGDYFM